MDWSKAFMISGVGYGLTILVLIIIAVLFWVITLTIKKEHKTK